MQDNLFYLGEPEIRASELKNCFYCGGSLPATKKEHIFNSCWGGSHKTSRLICDSCNAEFSKIDSTFSVYTTPIMNTWAFKGERHKEVPKIETKGDYIIEAYNKPKLKIPQFKEEAQPDGSFIMNFSFNSKKEARRWLLDDNKLEAYLGYPPTEDEQQKVRQAIQEAKPQSRDVEPQKLPTKTLNLKAQYRSAAHTLLKCLGLYAPKWVHDSRTSQVREFARYDKGSWWKFAVEVNLVEKQISLANQALDKLGVQCNAAEIYWCRSLEKIIGVVTILGRVKRSVLIAEDYNGPDAILTVIEDTYGSKKPPQPRFVQFNSEIPSLPLLEILSSPPPWEFFTQELSTLITHLDGLTAFLWDSIEKIARETPDITTTVLQKYEELFMDFALKLEKVFGVSVKPAEVSSKLATYGFSDLIQHHIGKSCKDDPDVRLILGIALSETYKDLTKPLISE